MSLRTLALTADDESLVAAEGRVIGDNYERGRHHIGAAVRMRDGHPAAQEARPEASVVSPCGMCRELISDFGLDAWVIIPSTDRQPRRSRSWTCCRRSTRARTRRAERALWDLTGRMGGLAGERGPVGDWPRSMRVSLKARNTFM